MSDAFWMMVSAVLVAVLPVLTVQWFQFKATERNAKKAEESREEIKVGLCEVKDHMATGVFNKQDAELTMKGKERELVQHGIEIGTKQATQPGALHPTPDTNYGPPK